VGSEEVRIFWSCDARGVLSCSSSAKACVCTVNGDDAVMLSVNGMPVTTAMSSSHWNLAIEESERTA
jgi:hypothetical protein